MGPPSCIDNNFTWTVGPVVEWQCNIDFNVISIRSSHEWYNTFLSYILCKTSISAAFQNNDLCNNYFVQCFMRVLQTDITIYLRQDQSSYE